MDERKPRASFLEARGFFGFVRRAAVEQRPALNALYHQTVFGS